MNIRLNALNNYANTGKISKVNSTSKDSSADKSSALRDKSDVITISSRAADYSDVARVQTEISNDINSLSSDSRIAAYKSAVANGEYNVSSKAVADKILDRFA